MNGRKILAVAAAAMTAGMIAITTSAKEAGQAPEMYQPAEKVVDKMGVKMARGICNAATGWGEIPRQMVLSYKQDGPWLMLPLGITRGLTMTVVRTGYGALETAFFYIPFDGTYDSALNPPYVWQEEIPVKDGRVDEKALREREDAGKGDEKVEPNADAPDTYGDKEEK